MMILTDQTKATMGRARHDDRDPATFTADLERETDVSLVRDPTRWRTKTVAETLPRPGNPPGRYGSKAV